MERWGEAILKGKEEWLVVGAEPTR